VRRRGLPFYASAVTYVLAHTAVNIPSQAKQLLNSARRREAKKRERRAQMAYRFAKQHRKGMRRRPASWSRANRHVFANKDMEM